MSDSPDTIAYCHSCGLAMDVSTVAPFSNVECPECKKHTRVKREFGPYTLVRRHAIGGMSMVFVAQDNTLGREVALKILSEEFSADERRIAAFEEEARITASFSNPYVVRVLRTGRAFGRFYIAMELVPGGHFEHQIRERGKIPEVELLPLAIEVTQGLKAAHEAGLIHRDVKPGNILLDAEGHAKLVDFGLALVTQGGKAQATELWATPYYVPPETVEGHEEDFRSDVYALGASLYHALSGKPSCNEETMATDILLESKKKVVPLSIADPTISTDTCHIVERAMQYNPNDRYSSYDEMLSELAASLANLKAGRFEPSASAKRRRALKKLRARRIAFMSGIVVLVLILITTIVVKLMFAKPAPHAGDASLTQKDPSVSVETDHSAEIFHSYRKARNSLKAGEYEIAGTKFHEIFNNPEVQEPTRTWAGIEAVLTYYFDGKTKDAREQAVAAVAHIRSLPDGGPHFDGALTMTLGKLGDLAPLSPSNSPDGDAVRVIASMLAGMKNWEQGMMDPAASCFKVVVSAKLSQDSEWASVYQKIAADYLADYQAITGSLFTKIPADKAGCLSAMDDLDVLLGKLKTRGRARFNVRAWQLDLARRAKFLEDAKNPNPTTTGTVQSSPQLSDVLGRLQVFSNECRFQDAVSYMKSLSVDPKGAKLESLLSVVNSSAVFVSDLERDLEKQSVSAELPLKSGETMVHIAMDSQGRITATNADGLSRSFKWSDFSPDALIALHRVFVKKLTDENERLRRHECAISFDWLAGNRERSLTAATVLSQSSPVFKKRWDAISRGLPK